MSFLTLYNQFVQNNPLQTFTKTPFEFLRSTCNKTMLLLPLQLVIYASPLSEFWWLLQQGNLVAPEWPAGNKKKKKTTHPRHQQILVVGVWNDKIPYECFHAKEDIH